MLLSELIAKLEKLKEKYGDNYVYAAVSVDDKSCTGADIKDVGIDADDLIVIDVTGPYTINKGRKTTKPDVGDRIRLIKNVCYGTAYGIVEVPKGTEMNVIERKSTDDGVVTDHLFESKSKLFPGTINVEVWDRQCVVVSKYKSIEH